MEGNDHHSGSDWIRLNVGGKIFQTTRATLTNDPHSMLARWFGSPDWKSATDESGAFLIDSNPKYFEPILHYLRTNEIVIDPNVSKKGVLTAAKYFQVQALIDELEPECAPSQAKTPKKAILVITYTNDKVFLTGERVHIDSVIQKYGFENELPILFQNSWCVEPDQEEKTGPQMERFIGMLLKDLLTNGWTITSSGGCIISLEKSLQ